MSIRASIWVVGLALGVFCGVGLVRADVEVIVTQVQQERVADQVEALGTLLANETVDITASVSDLVTAVRFEDGQRVNAGDILVELASKEEQALRTEFQHTVDEAEAQLSRIKQVAQRGDASQSLLDQQLRERNVALARLAAIEARISERSIKAPFAGVLGLRRVSVGAYVEPGDVLTTLIDDRQLKLDFSVPAIFLSRLRPGVPIVATSRVYPERAFTGSVVALDNRVDPVTRAITVRSVIPNKDQLLVPGLLLEVDLQTNERSALIIPEEALLPVGSRQMVFTVETLEGQSLAKRRTITIGARWPGKVEVVSGLSLGETVVIHGGDKLSDGAKVRVVTKQQVSEFLSRASQ